MDAHEAVDLIETLPMGSLWLAEASPAAEWSDERYLLTDILNSLNVIAAGLRYENEQPRLEYPIARENRLSQKRKAREVRERLKNTRWKEIRANG